MKLDIDTLISEVKLNGIDNISIEDYLNQLYERQISPKNFVDTCLELYISINYLIESKDSDIVNSFAHFLAIDQLTIDAHQPFLKSNGLGLLAIAQLISYKLMNESKILKEQYALVYLKTLLLQQHLHDTERFESVKSELIELTSINLDSLSRFDRIEFAFISAHLFAFYYEFERSEQMVEKLCKDYLEIKVKSFGALGKRTKYQTNEIPQLTLSIEKLKVSHEHEEHNIDLRMPKVILLKDDTLLNTVAFSNLAQDENVSKDDLAFILLLNDVHVLSYPRDSMSREQSQSYIEYVIREFERGKAFSWPLMTKALFERCRFDNQSYRRAERALEQFEELSNQFSYESPTLAQRSPRDLFISRMPNIWSLELEQANFLYEIGSTKSALDFYLKWDQWKNIIMCYQRMGQRELATNLIKERISKDGPSVELYLALGEATTEYEWYEKAWEHSNHRSAKAARSLARIHMFTRKDYPKAIEFFEKSLAISSLQADIWFTYGCCCLQMKEFEKAVKAFRRCTTLEPDNFEAWNNCASALLMNNQPEMALEIFNQAAKCSYDSKRIWENILIVATQLGKFKQTINAYNRLIDIEKNFSDGEVTSILTRAVIDNIKDGDDKPCIGLKESLLKLMARAVYADPKVSEIHMNHAKLLLHDCEKVELYQIACQSAQKAHHAIVKEKDNLWERDQVIRDRLLAYTNYWIDLIVDMSKRVPFQRDLTCDEEIFRQTQLRSLILNVTILEKRILTAISNISENPEEISKLEQALAEVREMHKSLLPHQK